MLPAIIEYLSSQELPGGGRLCRPGRLTFNFPLLPPGIQINFSVLPPFSAYAAIKYGMSYEALPGVIYIETEQGGDMYITGLIEADHMRELVPYYILYTEARPINVLMQNQSALAQRALGTQYMLIIDTEDGLEYVESQIKALSAIEGDRLAREANELLTAILRRGGP